MTPTTAAAARASAFPESQVSRARPRAVANWLLVVAAMIFLMVVVGGITRLTESGLSITRWEPISGTLPPLNEAQWTDEFRHYQQIPEYQQINRGMTLGEFKHIFFWEYVHRLLGRLIGVAFALPLLWFAVKRQIPPGYGPRLVVILALGGLQGAIGWWMVSSGLVDRTDVSHVRLAIHLLTALLIFSATLWTALDLLGPASRRISVPTLGIWTLAALAVQLMFGAYVAGLDAGYAFNTWPLMGDQLYPTAAEWMRPALRNFVDNPITVQFVHRWWAFVVLGFVILLARAVKRAGGRRESILIHAAVGLQILLGIATLLTGVKIEVAALHQATAVVLLATTLMAAHRLGEQRRSAAAAAA
ncbi:heme A synthase [Sphingomonas ginkgonis]|uniref:Heme A synthase n=1 Tax=Sphingomonas ginkgonis TaxID=2315330 RepID=A0A429V9R0_9SPHN|nr:COX15/CtaA family protein [Sphingomonas ginkgonis]RST30602.1 heme A synthase [Sphingomonas ginkgonis]